MIYFFDLGLYNPHRMENIKININKPIKEDKVLLYQNQNWEVRFDNSYPNVIYDDRLKKYRCFYSTFTKDDNAGINPYIPKEERIVSLCYAESDDGIDWKKPVLNKASFRGSTKNNIIGHFMHGTSVLYDKHEKDKNKKYKLFTKIDYGNGYSYLAVAFSADGINYGDFIKLNDFNPRADTHNFVIYDKKIEKYVLTSRVWSDSMRYSCISYSSDYINWSKENKIYLTTDFDNQVYSMPIFKKGEYIIGLASIYHEADILADNYDTVDLKLAYSYKYGDFHFISNDNFITRGEKYDSSCIFASNPIKINDKTYFYYMGSDGLHTANRNGYLMRAYIEGDNIAYTSQKDESKISSFFTNDMYFLNDKFELEADILADGFIDIKLYDKNFEVIDNKVNVERIEKNKFLVSFEKETNRNILKLNIQFKNARLYGIDGDFELIRF